MAVGEWDRRELCPDGGCVGVIGSDGQCKVCGRAATNWGNERERGLGDGAADDEDVEDDDDDELADDGDASEEEDDADDEDVEDDDDEDADDEDDELAPATPTRLGEVAEWHERKLCPDGACVGVIGDGGTCKVCGRTAA